MITILPPTLSCVALAECSFVTQTKDANHNNRFTYGSDPGFEIKIRGNSGWAAEGRINGVVTLLPPVVVSGATVTSNDWRHIGEADAVHLSSRLATKSSFMGIQLRAHNIAIDGIMYTVSPSGKFDSTSIPLLSPYLGMTKQVAIFKASKACPKWHPHCQVYTVGSWIILDGCQAFSCKRNAAGDYVYSFIFFRFPAPSL
jgi:hypothetical protein